MRKNGGNLKFNFNFALMWYRKIGVANIIICCAVHTPVYPSFHLSVLWVEVVSNPRCLSVIVIHTLDF